MVPCLFVYVSLTLNGIHLKICCWFGNLSEQMLGVKVLDIGVTFLCRCIGSCYIKGQHKVYPMVTWVSVCPLPVGA